MPVMSKLFRPQATWSFQTAGILQMFRMKWSPSVTVSPLDLKKASRKVCGLYSMTYIRTVYTFMLCTYVCMCMHSCCKVGHASLHTLLVCGMWVSLYTGMSYQLNPYSHKISLLSVTLYLWYVVLPKTLAKVSQKGQMSWEHTGCPSVCFLDQPDSFLQSYSSWQLRPLLKSTDFVFGMLMSASDALCVCVCL